ncbi:hypothetical protein [Candidatus Nitrotoga sp. M5]|uniref:hypothetical protein n=1 Tax=Candidatus Nitrotoga sp. M5 TaxID=2890409 RepID=UPI001EF6517C|nr:hypothetical protein [Candidatus Nitrotoga sp. M5]
MTNSKHHFDTLNPAQKILASENKFNPSIKKVEEARECKICLVPKPLSAFINGSRRCNQCIRALRLEKYRLSVLAKEAVKKRWCMSCKKKHPVSEFKSAQSRRCIAALLAHEKNKTAYNTQKNREWREKAKAAKALLTRT